MLGADNSTDGHGKASGACVLLPAVLGSSSGIWRWICAAARITVNIVASDLRP